MSSNRESENRARPNATTAPTTATARARNSWDEGVIRLDRTDSRNAFAGTVRGSTSTAPTNATRRATPIVRYFRNSSVALQRRGAARLCGLVGSSPRRDNTKRGGGGG